MGFSVGIVSNAYWAVSIADAIELLQPFAGRLADLTVSSDLYHCEKVLGEQAQNASAAAKWMNIPTDLISIDQPDASAAQTHGQITGQSAVMFRGRAGVGVGSPYPSCHAPSMGGIHGMSARGSARTPARIHVDPLGNLHICQGVIIGNLFEKPLKDL